MRESLKRTRVNGFLRTEGTKIVNEAGEEILLTGWGLGNYLLCEGYMWLAGPRMDRPRRIEEVVREVAGSEYAESFWKKYHENYITEADIARMAELGYNSVRIPINARLFLKEEPGLQWVDEGFLLLDRVIDFCEKHRVYAFIDLHGAPGGQTGSNIDDSIDNLPRLFTDPDFYEKGIALWKKLAERYRDRWIVGGYDLLNEPLRTARKQLPDGTPDPDDDMAKYLPLLQKFYEDCIAAIRTVDKRHILSLEGHHWASRPECFDRPFDPETVIHFHRYACLPGSEIYADFLEKSRELNVPLWLGETGENYPEWYAGMYPLALDLGIGFNIWPWKKLFAGPVRNNPYKIPTPANWNKIIDYAKGGPKPSYAEAQAILDEFLENMRFENCEFSEKVHASLFRRPGTTVRATDFDELPLPDGSLPYTFLPGHENETAYRKNTGAKLTQRFPDVEKAFSFDVMMMRYTLSLDAGESVRYSFYDSSAENLLDVTGFFFPDSGFRIKLFRDGKPEACAVNKYAFGACEDPAPGQFSIAGLPIPAAERITIEVEVLEGSIELEALTLK
ncbi:MAG: cellulase family glycosylhydrolase [Lachnospiraceae bacterium]|nr:cellulase family glycosylhydrolase [Lachnospiraceae bacterium]